MKIFLSIAFMTFMAITMQAQSTLQNQEEEDSTITVVGYFCKNDTLVYHRVQGKEKIIGNDTTLLNEIVEDFMIVVTDSAADGYKMELTPMSCQVRGKEIDYEGRMASLLWKEIKDLRCRFTTDEWGAVQHIENWRDIRNVLKKSYVTVFDSLYSELPKLDSIMPRKQLEGLLLLGCSTEDGIKEQYDELEMLFGLHGTVLPKKPVETDDVSEKGFSTHNYLEAFYSKQKDEYDFDGDYVALCRVETSLSSDDVEELMNSTMGALFSVEVGDSVIKYASEGLKKNKEGMKVNEIGQYCYFYNGWPKLMQSIKETNLGNLVKRVEYDSIEWTSRHWGVFTFPDEEDTGKKM